MKVILAEKAHRKFILDMFDDSSQNTTIRSNDSAYDQTAIQDVDSQATVIGGSQVTFQEEPVTPTMNR